MILLLLALAGSAAADAPVVDWARGVITADGLGIADRHAPSPAAAREPARRAAEDAARVQLAAAVAKLPLAGGGAVKSKLADKAVKARIDHAVATALVLDFTPETDGSWRVTMALPLEAVHQALRGPRAITSSDSGPAIVIVEGATTRPAIGVTVAGHDAPVLWTRDVPAWGASAPRTRATRSSATAIELDPAAPTGPGTLFLVVSR